MMRYIISLVMLLWAIPSWGSGLDQQQSALLRNYLQQGTTREKLLALSMLPKPNCHAPASRESLLVLQAMRDADPLVREMSAYYVRREITRAAIPSRLDYDEDDFPLSPAMPDNGSTVKIIRSFARQQGICGSQPIIKAFLEAAVDTVPRIRMESALGLGFTGDQRVVPTVVSLAKDPDPFVRAAAAFGLGELRAKEGAQVLATLANTASDDWRDYYARREALKALRKIWVANFRRKVFKGPAGYRSHEQFDETLRKLAVTTAVAAAGDAVLTRETYELLAEIRAPEAVSVLRAGVPDPDPVIRLSATRGLLRLAGDQQACGDCEKIFTAAAADRDARVRVAALHGLGRLLRGKCNNTILKAFDDPDGNVRIAAIGTIRSADPLLLEKLAAALSDNEKIRSTALISLYRATRTDDDFAAAKEIRRPPAVGPHKSYIWIAPDPSRIRKIRSRNKSIIAGKKGLSSSARLRNDLVVDKIMAVYPVLSRDEKMYALEVLSHFDQPKVTPFLLHCSNDTDQISAIKAMEVAMAYAPDESLQAVAARLTSKNVHVRDAAYRMLSGIASDFPVSRFASLAEDPSPKNRRRFFELVKGMSDPLLPSICLKGLQDDDAAVRTAAAAFFQEHAEPRAVEPLVAMLGRSRSETSAAVSALAVQDESALEPLLDVVTERDGVYELNDKVEALFGIVNYDRERTVPALLDFLEKTPDPDNPLTDRVIRALVGLKERRMVPILLKYLGEDKGRGSFAAQALFYLGDPSSLEPLRIIIECPDEPLEKRKQALLAYANGGTEATGYLLALARRSTDLRQAAVKHLQIQKPEDLKAAAGIAGRNPAEYREILTMIGGAHYRISLEHTATLLRDTDIAVVKGAILLLRASGNPKAIDQLRGFVDERDQSVQTIAAEAVQYIKEKNIKSRKGLSDNA